MSKAFLFLIRAYQLILSPVITSLGGRCRFHPSCSSYAAKAFRKFSWYYAILLTIRRVFRCGPWHAGGVDAI